MLCASDWRPEREHEMAGLFFRQHCSLRAAHAYGEVDSMDFFACMDLALLDVTRVTMHFYALVESECTNVLLLTWLID